MEVQREAGLLAGGQRQLGEQVLLVPLDHLPQGDWNNKVGVRAKGGNMKNTPLGWLE